MRRLFGICVGHESPRVYPQEFFYFICFGQRWDGRIQTAMSAVDSGATLDHFDLGYDGWDDGCAVCQVFHQGIHTLADLPALSC